jgi:hypothetical protein
VNIVAFLYHFDSLSIGFIKGLFEYLLDCKHSTAAHMLSHILTLTGPKIRADDPTILKAIIVKAEQSVRLTEGLPPESAKRYELFKLELH